MTGELYLGLDLASSSRIPTAYGVLDQRLGLPELGFLGTDQEILECARRLRPQVIAIDAPLFLPLGLCCLEETCPCRQVFPLPGRRVERAWSKEGISSYYVTKKTFVKGWVYRGMALARALREARLRAIEVFPYASKVRLFGKPLPAKDRAAGRAFLRDRMTALIPDLARLARPLSHHELDALLAAYTGYLYQHGATQAVGHALEGFAYLPLMVVYKIE